jgi:ribosomal-protein-alanine N-acetyltransferase
MSGNDALEVLDAAVASAREALLELGEELLDVGRQRCGSVARLTLLVREAVEQIRGDGDLREQHERHQVDRCEFHAWHLRVLMTKKRRSSRSGSVNPRLARERPREGMLSAVDDLQLRPARGCDAREIAALAHAFVEHGLRPSWTAPRILRHIRHAESVVLTADSLGMLAGFALMQYGDTSAHLNLLAVVPAHRRRGVGRRLVRWLEATALTAGTFVIELELRAANRGARLFYESLGYREVALLRGYYQGIEDALRMQRDVRTRDLAQSY